MSALNGRILSGLFPILLGHEGSGIVESVGEGVTDFKKGDHVITLFLPQCRDCKICKHETANACMQFFGNQLKGVMQDGTSRIRCRDQPIYTFTGCSTFAEYSVMSAMNLCKINDKAALDKVFVLSCGMTTGYGAAVNTAKVKKGSSCAVWGLGALGLAAIMGCRDSGASRIIAIDINPSKFDVARHFGATECLNPKDIGEKTIQDYLREKTQGGVDYTFECVGNIDLMQQAFESAAIGYGMCVLVGVAPNGKPLQLLPIDFEAGRTLKGTFFGCYKSVDSVPKLVDRYVNGEMNFDRLITHSMQLDEINKAFDLLKNGEAVRTVIHMA